jgi:autoinducer binding domain-containing protein
MHDDTDLAKEPTDAFASFAGATQYLEQACARMNVNHLAYALMNSREGIPELVSWIATYDPAYMSYYMEYHTQLGDPAFETAFANNSVMDWVEMATRDPVSQELLAMAARYGITKYGISIPLMGDDFGNVLFSVNVKSNDKEWLLVRESLVERFRPFALYFHGRAKPLIQARKFAEINFAT